MRYRLPERSEGSKSAPRLCNALNLTKAAIPCCGIAGFFGLRPQNDGNVEHAGLTLTAVDEPDLLDYVPQKVWVTRSSGSGVYKGWEKYPSRWGICSGRHDQEVYDGEPGKNSPFAENQRSQGLKSIFGVEIFPFSYVRGRERERER